MPVIVIAPLAAIVIALLALLLFYALHQLLQTFANGIPSYKFPFVGSLRTAFLNAENTIYTYVVNALVSTLTDLWKLIQAPITVLTHLFDQAEATMDSIYNSAHWIINNYVPAKLAVLSGDLEKLINDARAYALSEVQQLYNTLHLEETNLYDSAVSQIDHLYNVLHAEVATALATAESAADHIYNVLEGDIMSIRGYADSLISSLDNSLRALIADGIREAETTAQTLIGAAITDIDHDAAAAVEAVWPDVKAGVDGVIDVAAGGFTDATDLLKGLDLSKAAGLVGAGAAALVGVSALLHLAEDCTIPNCKNLSGFGRDLQALLGLVSDGALIAFLADAASNPAGTAEAISSTIGGAYSDVARGLESLIGIA